LEGTSKVLRQIKIRAGTLLLMQSSHHMVDRELAVTTNCYSHRDFVRYYMSKYSLFV
jgi:hypothetical protein